MALRRWGTGIDSSSKILESTSLDGMKSVASACMEGLGSPSASRIRLLAKHRFDFRVLIGSSGAIPMLNRATIGVCRAIPPPVTLLVGGSMQSKKVALATLGKRAPHDGTMSMR
ncbi:hypothetical protein GW17_00008130 [Ensete ventricosum]|nr:hypothetical protein GW17_00008130 [Ensete ventricosum]